MGKSLGSVFISLKYGVWDICVLVQRYYGCLKFLFSKVKSIREKFIMMIMKKLYMDIEGFVNGICVKLSKL